MPVLPSILMVSLRLFRPLGALLWVQLTFFLSLSNGETRPNIVFILTDNQGAWQLGCYGNPDFQTPNIDRLASEGVRFTHAFANNAVCSPTRATYLTGLTPSQHGVHRYLSRGRLQMGPAARYTLEEFTTLPEILHREGYVCGLSGKWHLGDNANPQDGFSFWVTKEHGHSTGFLNQDVLEDGEFKTIGKHLSEYWTDRGIEFLDSARAEHPEKPFFLFLAYNGPYTLSGAMREPVPSPWSDPYRNHELPSFPRPSRIHSWQRNQHDLIGDLEAGRNLAGQVTAVDAGVGRILDYLKQQGLDDNTLVVYAADQGAVAGHAGFWGMGDHTVPLHGRDGTMHIPMLFRWPGTIPGGQIRDEIVTNYDFLPSVLSLLGLDMPTEPLPSPGRDFSPALRGRELLDWDDTVFYEFENVRSVRTRTWKYGERLGQSPEVELYDLEADPDEVVNLAAAPEHADQQAELQGRLHAWFERYTDPKWDLWKGGSSKSNIGTAGQIRAGIEQRKAANDPAPKHRAIRLEGLHAYAGRESVPAGGTIGLHVSSQVPYRLRVTKLGTEVDNRDSDVTIYQPLHGFEPRVQPIQPGSYVKLAKSLPAEPPLESLSVEAWVRPWNGKRWQGILTQHDYPTDCGFGLFLNGSGKPVFSMGTGGEYDGSATVEGNEPLKIRTWHHLVGTWDGNRAVLYVDGVPAGEWVAPVDSPPRRAGRAALRLGAYGDQGQIGSFLDGDLAGPALYGNALSAEAIAARFQARGLESFPDGEPIAVWPLDEERGKRIADATGNGFDGEIVNLGTWMIGGPSFDAAEVGRFESDYDPAKDDDRGHGLRLSASDLYDCGWEQRHSVRIPKNAKSGIYAAWFDFELDGVSHHYPVTFIVNRASDAEKAPIALMCATTTWRAYNGTAFGKNDPNPMPYFSTGGAKQNDPASPPGYNFYRDHPSGQPSYQVGLRIPWPAAGPGVLYSDPKIGYSHLMRGERFTHVWLEKQGYDFDVITNLDLHRDPDLLSGYGTLIINGHDEYWSRDMYEGLERYLKNGGTATVLSGNTMFWRISVDDELGVIECRKYGPTIGGRKFARVGEVYHSHDGRRGSLMRNCDLPPWKAIGLECSGWWGGANNGVYRIDEGARDHFLFQSPEVISFADRTEFGSSKSGQRKACGHEGDIRLSSYVPPGGIPEGAVFPEEPGGIQTLASLKRKNARVLDYFAEFGQQENATLVDMIYWERPEGGKVFNAGAIGFGWALDVDPKQTKLLRNVLFHLAGVKAKTPYDPVWDDEEGSSSPPGSPNGGHRGASDLAKVVVPETDHALLLPSGEAKLTGRSVKVNPRHGALAWWKSPEDRATWTVRGAKPGTYVVVLDYAVPDKLAGQEFTLTAAEDSLRTKAETTGGWGKWEVRRFGEIRIPKSDLTITFAPTEKVRGEDLLDLRSIQLIPPGSPRLKNLSSIAAPAPALPHTSPKTLPGNHPEPVSAGKDGVFILTGRTATIRGEAVELIPSNDPNHPEAAIAGWSNAGERAEWELRGIEKGRFDVLVDWAMPRVPGGLQKASLTLDDKPLFSGAIRTTEGEDRFARYVLGTVELPGGDHTISFGPAGGAETWVRLRSLRLVPAAKEGEFVIPPLTVPEGFVIEPAAIPPLVAHPMMACLDDRGRMFISESAGTNAKAAELLETRPHKILMLEDEDGDGVFDQSTVFADDLVLPNGAQWHDGSLYVCSPPYIWKFTDTDEDGVADERVPVSGKFGFNGMSSAFHGPVLGPDGRMYWCGGQHGWKLGDTSPGLDLTPENWMTSRGPGVFSMWPDGSDPENRAQGGLANPVEVTFSSEGEVFGTVAVYEHLNGRTDALLHWIQGTIYNLKRRGPPVHPRTSRKNLPPMSRRGWVAPPGLCRYRSGDFANGFGQDYRDDLFMAEFNTHRVYRIKPERKGASYITSDEIFLESTSPYTHFTDVFEDADGSLLVVDTGGWFLYGCPTSAIERPEIKGAIYRIRRADAKPVGDARGEELDWANPSVDWLDDPRFVVRDRAKAELAKLGEAILPELEAILVDQESSERRCREAIWTLTRIDHADARESASFTMLDHPSPSVRLAAARSLSVWRGGPTRNQKMSAAGALDQVFRNRDEPQVLREAATALGRTGVAGGTVLTLVEEVRRNGGEDRYLDHSLIYALIEIDHENLTRTFLKDEDPNVQRAALIACAEMKSSRLAAEDVAPLLYEDDPELRAEALRIATARPDWGGSLAGFLKSALMARRVAPELGEALLAFSGNAKVQPLIAESLRREPTHKIALEVIRRATLEKTPDSWKAALRQTLDDSLTVPLIEAAGSRRDFDYDWKSVARDRALARPARLAALDVVTKDGGPIDDEEFALLSGLLESKTAAPAHRLRAAAILGRVRLNQDQKEQCAGLVQEAGPLEIGLLLEVFEPADRGELLELLAKSLVDSPALFSVSSTTIEAVFGGHAAGDSLRQTLRSTEEARDARLDELTQAISNETGDPERGREAFVKATCLVCHRVQGEGGIIGPELTTIGAIRSERDLLEAIAFPSATFAREYEPHVLTLKDGTVRMGRLGNETDHGVDVIDAAGQSVTLPLTQIANREMGSISLMPPGLERLLSPGELADLMAYLRNLR